MRYRKTKQESYPTVIQRAFKKRKAILQSLREASTPYETEDTEKADIPEENEEESEHETEHPGVSEPSERLTVHEAARILGQSTSQRKRKAIHQNIRKRWQGHEKRKRGKERTQAVYPDEED